MTCPIPDEVLVRYWLHDLSEDETDEVDLHLLGCDSCSEASARLGALATALPAVVPPIVLPGELERVRAQGAEPVVNTFDPDSPGEARLGAGADLLVHRLHLGLEDAEQVSVRVETLDGGALVAFADVPFDPAEEAVLVACQRHFVERFPPDTRFVVRCRRTGGRETRHDYVVMHRVT